MTINGRTVLFTRHADQRWMERGSRFDDLGQAAAELRLLAGKHGRLGPIPGWAATRDHPDGGLGLLVGDDFAFPLEESRGVLVAMTLLARGSCRATSAKRHRPRARRVPRRATRSRRRERALEETA